MSQPSKAILRPSGDHAGVRTSRARQPPLPAPVGAHDVERGSSLQTAADEGDLRLALRSVRGEPRPRRRRGHGSGGSASPTVTTRPAPRSWIGFAGILPIPFRSRSTRLSKRPSTLPVSGSVSAAQQPLASRPDGVPDPGTARGVGRRRRGLPRRAKPRALLAVLLLHPNEVVPADRLIDELWGEDSPEDAAAALRVNVSRLRKALPRTC